MKLPPKNSETKLPTKQWKHWCKSAKLKPHFGSKRDQNNWYYLKGHGRVWRLNCHDQLECGDTYADFDRWALCDIESTAKPKTHTEFMAAVKQLLSAHKSKGATL